MIVLRRVVEIVEESLHSVTDFKCLHIVTRFGVCYTIPSITVASSCRELVGDIYAVSIAACGLRVTRPWLAEAYRGKHQQCD